jgi:hypothetical protein
MLQVFVSERVTCLLLLFDNPSLGVVKALNNINVAESSPASRKFIKSTSTTHLPCFNSFKSSTVEKQFTTVVKVVSGVSISLQQICGESSGADTLASKVLEHHGLPFATKITKTLQSETGSMNT